MARVETSALTKRYRDLAALDECTLSIGPGEVFGLLGPNGSGKSTLLRLLMGFLRPTRGRATIANRDCYRDSVAVHAGVSYLPGDVRLFRGMNGQEVLTFLSQLRRGQDLSRSVQLAERLGLTISRPVTQMSTGMRQKLALSAVLAVDVPLFILDEPTSNFRSHSPCHNCVAGSRSQGCGPDRNILLARAVGSGAGLRPCGHSSPRSFGSRPGDDGASAATSNFRSADIFLAPGAGAAERAGKSDIGKRRSRGHRNAR